MTTEARTFRTALSSFGHTWLRLSLRRFAAGIMLIMGAGRLGLYATASQSVTLTVAQYGVLLVVFGLALWPNGRFRLSIGGRVVAALGAILMFGMAWDVGVISVTSLIEAWLALALLKEVFTSNDC
jgi:hypothetical protein